MASSRIRHARSAKRADSDAVREACTLWMKLVPAIPPTKTQFASNAFALSLDPQRYPLIPAEDGGAILVDSKGSLPAPVKSLIQSKNRKIRVVSESPENRRRFYGCLLNAAGFHSVREDSVIEFGNAATITVQADFQVEKNQDSLLHQDVILLNVGQSRSRTPAALVKFLAENGFRVLESGTAANDRKAGAGHLLYQVTGNDPRALSDALLTALGVSFEKGKTIDIYQGEGLGLSLEVTADRYFELQGKRYVVALFDNDPGSDTVAGLLKNRGYRVILLKEGDELHDVAEKMSRQMELKTGYQEYDLWSLREVGYGVRMPGVMLRDRRHGDRKIFVTDRQLDPLLQDLAEVNGYRVVKK